MSQERLTEEEMCLDPRSLGDPGDDFVHEGVDLACGALDATKVLSEMIIKFKSAAIGVIRDESMSSID